MPGGNPETFTDPSGLIFGLGKFFNWLGGLFGGGGHQRETHHARVRRLTGYGLGMFFGPINMEIARVVEPVSHAFQVATRVFSRLMAKSLKQSMNQVFDIHGIVRDLNILTSSDTHPRERLRVGLKLAFNIGLDALNFVDFGEGSLIDDGIHVADDL
jgi:hypothetical protein